MRHSACLIVLFFITLCSTGAQAQDFVLQGRVVDAETGEPLPYTAIYVEKGRGSLTNIEGDYRLSVSNQDVLTFSFVGFEKLKLKASEVPRVIQLKPFSSALKEVEVVPIDELDILKQVINNLKQDFSKHKKDRQGYFMRTLLKNEEDSYLIESLMTARSAVNLREERTDGPELRRQHQSYGLEAHQYTEGNGNWAVCLHERLLGESHQAAL